jgi:hypothetical protein
MGLLYLLCLKSKVTFDHRLFNAQMFLQPHLVSHRGHDLFELYKPINARDHNCKQVFMQSVCHFCPILIKLELSSHVLLKFSKLEHQENPPRGSRSVTGGRNVVTQLIVADRNL